VDDVSRSLSIPPSMARALLSQFTRHGFTFAENACYKYRAVDSEQDHSIHKLGETYRARRVAVTNEIYSKPNARLKSFADAFRIRREP
jgi:hypothetical protein